MVEVKKMKRVRTSEFLPAESEPLSGPDLTEPADLSYSQSIERENTASSRLGGIDGIMSIMGKVQQFWGIFQQIQPAFKMVGSLMGTKAFVSSMPSKKTRMKNKYSRKKARVATIGRLKTKSRA
ncbi:hypothetical protein [Paenibacillus sp. LHD-38]|uniref:hypothetical protein n=1 Tax=Paenibacillus sp. LHD-38 TaxID=3072143 RepID=UPI00280D994C|nr:hypothetical protein [Paenibacillus sp. LHD-38]MDQ8737193.1 hypothetical protein [Paenibacillus sp. LHD-38]